ncbi:hypothetical protein EG328_010106 [Venturia inaequalis]|uniref:Uncharacterized protein n=1 Tax=Venturia inaequalis TaxID=5025 RepID=A0A8H3Z4W1_VENIN|nr:hypothetical protein EG328_010106 [Venturia inaequalis]
MKFTLALVIAFLSATVSAGPRTACLALPGKDQWGYCRVYMANNWQQVTGEQYPCLPESPCNVNEHGCILVKRNGKVVGKCNG